MKPSQGGEFHVLVDVDKSSGRDSLGETTESSNFTTYQRRKSQIEVSQYVRKCCGITIIGSVIILFILVILLSTGRLGDEQTNLSAGIRFHHHHKTMDEQCNGTTYGCCEVYNLCDLHDDGNFTYTHERIWPSVQIKSNKDGTNCPRMNQIVRKYSLNYYPRENNGVHYSPWENSGNFNCMNSTYGCCSIDISCDVYVYVMVDISHNTNYSYYKSSTPIERYINYAKENEIGTNCPSFNHIVWSYNNEFYDPIYDLGILLIHSILLCLLVASIKRSGSSN